MREPNLPKRGRGRTAWREEILREADRVEADLDRGTLRLDSEGSRHVLENLAVAEEAATSTHKTLERVRYWWNGVDIDSAWRAIHAAKQGLIEGMEESDLRAQYPILRSKVGLYIPKDDPERVAYEEWLDPRQDPKNPPDRSRLRTVRTAVDGASDAHFGRIHSFRNTLYLLFVGVLLLDILLIFDPPTDPWLPICGPGATEAETESCPLVWHIELVGLVGGALAVAAALLAIPVVREPYNLKRAQTLVKLPLSALTALVGTMLLQSNFIDALEPQPTPTVLVYGVIFGYSQQLVTRLIDRKAESLVATE